MNGELGLEIGAQTQAAKIVEEAAPDVMEILKDVQTSAQESLGKLVGSGARGAADAIGAWLHVAVTVPVDMNAYAQGLVNVDGIMYGVDVELVAPQMNKFHSLLGGPQ